VDGHEVYRKAEVLGEGAKERMEIYGLNTIKLHWDNFPGGEPSGIVDGLYGNKRSSVL
jgi:hypothetical protein